MRDALIPSALACARQAFAKRTTPCSWNAPPHNGVRKDAPRFRPYGRDRRPSPWAPVAHIRPCQRAAHTCMPNEQEVKASIAQTTTKLMQSRWRRHPRVKPRKTSRPPPPTGSRQRIVMSCGTMARPRALFRFDLRVAEFAQREDRNRRCECDTCQRHLPLRQAASRSLVGGGDKAKAHAEGQEPQAVGRLTPNTSAPSPQGHLPTLALASAPHLSGRPSQLLAQRVRGTLSRRMDKQALRFEGACTRSPKTGEETRVRIATNKAFLARAESTGPSITPAAPPTESADRKRRKSRRGAPTLGHTSPRAWRDGEFSRCGWPKLPLAEA